MGILNTTLASAGTYGTLAMTQLLPLLGEDEVTNSVAIFNVVADAAEGVSTDVLVAVLARRKLLLWTGSAFSTDDGPDTVRLVASTCQILPKRTVVGLNVHTAVDETNNCTHSLGVAIRISDPDGADVDLVGRSCDEDEGSGTPHWHLRGSWGNDSTVLFAETAINGAETVANLSAFAADLAAWLDD